MKNAVLLGTALMLCTALALAQEAPSAGASSQAGSSVSSSDQAATGNNKIEGCLTGTSGNYMLTDATGVTYKVQGDESQLSENVNKEIEVTGTMGSKASASVTNNADSSAPGSSTSGDASASAGGASETSTGATATASAAKTLEVTSVKKVADSCGAGK
jgi:hypothetical protein